MKRFIYSTIVTIALFLTNEAKGQTFFEASYGRSFFETAQFDLESGVNLNGGNRLNFQFGKFVNNRVSRTISLSYARSTSDDIEQRSEVRSSLATPQNRTVNFILSSTDIEYERKKTKFNTEFDDVWNIYSIVSVGVSFYTLKEDVVVPPPTSTGISFPENDAVGSDLIFMAGYGWGAARKIHKTAYVFSDLRATLALGNIYNRFPIYLNFGYKQFL